MIDPFSIKLSIPVISKFMKLEQDLTVLQANEKIFNQEEEILSILIEEDAINTHQRIDIGNIKETLREKVFSPRYQFLSDNKKALDYIFSSKKSDWTIFHLKKIYQYTKPPRNLEESTQIFRNTRELKADFSTTYGFMHVDFEYAPIEEIQGLMEEFCAWMNKKDDHFHPLLKIGVALPLFGIIAPFQSHNARMLRFIALDLLGFYGYVVLQRSLLLREMTTKTVSDKLAQTLKNLSEGEMNFVPWLESWVNILQTTASYKEKGLPSFSRIRLESPTSVKIQEAFKENKQLTISQIAFLTKINRNTLKNYLRNHVKAGLLIQKGDKKSSWYELKG